MPIRTATHLAIALVSAAVILYQIAITRLLSVVLWYHFAFLAVSIAMLGLGAAGVWFTLRPVGPHSLQRLLLCAAAGLPLSVWVILQTRAPGTHGAASSWWLAAVALAMLVPLYALGGVVCSLLLQARGPQVASLYAADLLGATCGAALVVPGLSVVPTPSLIAALGLLPLFALALVGGVRRPSWLCGALLLSALLVWGQPFSVRYSKLYAEQGEKTPLYELWTPTARITVFERPIFAPDPSVPWGWGYGARFVPKPWPERWIDQDGSAGTPVERLGASPTELTHLGFDVTSAGYQIFAPQRVCVIGAGGGRDIATALAFGARTVDAVELNRGIYRLMTGALAGFSGHIYTRPGVHTVVSEGRSFLTRSAKRYDLIQISLVDSWAATTAGAFALSENYLYTVEALRLYLSRLAPGGVLSISRWSDRVQPFETARLALLAEAALRREGVADPRRQLLLMAAFSVGNLLISKRPIDARTLARADAVAKQRGFVRRWPPPAGRLGVSLASAALADGGAALGEMGLDLTPPSDDRPFFFQARRMFEGGEQVDRAAPQDVNLAAVGLLRNLVWLLFALTLVLFFTPFAWRRRPARGAGFWTGSGYFAAIGVGFMLLELSGLQLSVLFLGSPSSATAVVLGALLAGAGAGSLTVGRLRTPLTPAAFWLLPAAALGLALGLGPAFRACLGLPLGGRCLIAASIFGCAGLVLGVALPSGLLRFSRAHRAWFWAVNGATSVLASALSVALAMAWGLRDTALLGAAAYALAALCVRRTHHNSEPDH